jgi:hypothetical protein
VKRNLAGIPRRGGGSEARTGPGGRLQDTRGGLKRVDVVKEELRRGGERGKKDRRCCCREGKWVHVTAGRHRAGGLGMGGGVHASGTHPESRGSLED